MKWALFLGPFLAFQSYNIEMAGNGPGDEATCEVCTTGTVYLEFHLSLSLSLITLPNTHKTNIFDIKKNTIVKQKTYTDMSALNIPLHKVHVLQVSALRLLPLLPP